MMDTDRITPIVTREEVERGVDKALRYGIMRRWLRLLRYMLGWVFVRPRRWLFHKLVWNYELHLLPKKREWLGWEWPNLHWWILYLTLFKFCEWLNYDAWRPLCRWGKHGRETFPWYARAIKRIGKTTAGCAISGGECYHCASEEGCQVDLSNDETGTTFKLERTWTSSSQDGTDYRFCGTTICPKCGYEDYYEDGSL